MPEVDAEHLLNTGDHAALAAIQAHARELPAAPTMITTLSAAGRSTAVVSAGSPGSSVLQGLAPRHLMINVRGVVRPDAEMPSLIGRYGPFPPASIPATARNDRVADIVIDECLPNDRTLMIAWFSDPDTTQHEAGLGSPRAERAIREADGRLARILDAIDRLGLAGRLDVLVGSDHGFSTISPRLNLAAELRAAGIAPERVLPASGRIYLRDRDPQLEADVVAFLTQHADIGPVFTRDGAPGTLALADAHIDPAAAPPHVAFSYAWSDARNAFGIAGAAGGGGRAASHGTLSPFDMRSLLVAAGPSFRPGVSSGLPSGNIDLAPTVLHVLGLEDTGAVDGRVLREALADRSPANHLAARPETVATRGPTGPGTHTLAGWRVGRVHYVSESRRV